MPLEAWLIAGALYVGLVAVTRAVAKNVKAALAFSRHALSADVPPTAVVDIASEAEGYELAGAHQVPAPGT